MRNTWLYFIQLRLLMKNWLNKTKIHQIDKRLINRFSILYFVLSISGVAIAEKVLWAQPQFHEIISKIDHNEKYIFFLG